VTLYYPGCALFLMGSPCIILNLKKGDFAMKIKFRAFALLLALIFALTFTGCGQKTGGGDPSDAAADVPENAADDTAGTEPGETTGEETLSDPRDKFEAFDLGGRTIRFSANWEVVPDSSMEKPDPTKELGETIAKYENLKRVEQKYKCKIEMIIVPWEELLPQLTTSVSAGDPYTDVAFLPMNFSFPAIANGHLLPLSEVTSPNSDVNTDQKVVVPIDDILGDKYLVQTVKLGDSGKFMGYNKTMVENLGLEDPQALYKANKANWNWDKFVEYAKAATKDNDGDGKIDSYGYAGFINYAVSNFVVTNGGYIFDGVTDKHGLEDSKTMEALEFINKLYNEHKVVYNAEGDIWNYDANFNAYKEGNIMFWPVQDWMLAEAKTTFPFKYSLVPFPVGPGGSTDKAYAASYDGFSIPKGVKDPKIVYQVMEELLWFFGDDPSIRDDSTMEWLQGFWLTQEDVDLSIEISNNYGKLELFEFVPDFPMGDIIGNVLSGEKTVAQAVEAYKQVAQDAIDALIKKE
jgi:multiple sugar transport system substrate-binding protein